MAEPNVIQTQPKFGDTTIRDQLAAIIGARRWHTNEAGGQHAATADAILAAGFRPPARVITDPAELDALPRGSAVLTRNGRVWQKAVTAATEWWPALSNWERAATSGQLLGMGIVTVLHVPADDWLRFVPTEEARDGE